PGVLQALRSLSAADIQLACITNKDSAFALPLLQQAELSGLLAFTLCADRVEDRKPSPNMLLAACSRLGIAPAQMLYVGDSGGDIAAAQAAGCRVVAVTYGYGNAQSLAAARPDGLIGQLADLVTLYGRPGRARADLDSCPTGAP
ncbi:MAG TPA: HAD-IA family hydrolase, partial [Steroidobacteraceae bacterium]|nr:HAD-IA family hydrolase [Steroidobacteraceae bacterium]